VGVRAITVGQTKNYVSESDPDKGTDKETVFEIGALDVFVNAQLTDQSTVFHDGGASIHTQTLALSRVRFGLKSLRNFRTADNKVVAFKTEDVQLGARTYKVVSDEIIMKMDPELINELARAITDYNTVPPDEAKNSAKA
jgi:hypothetical protein